MLDADKKRVQVFGYNYLYPQVPAVTIPDYLRPILDQLRARGFGADYDQLIISEYLPGMGFKAHIDRLFWGESVIGISLLSSCTLR